MSHNPIEQIEAVLPESRVGAVTVDVADLQAVLELAKRIDRILDVMTSGDAPDIGDVRSVIDRNPALVASTYDRVLDLVLGYE